MSQLVVSSDLTEMSNDDSDTDFLLCNETIDNVSDTEVLVFDDALDGCTEFPPDTTSYLQETVPRSSQDPNIVDTQCRGSASLTADEELHELIVGHWLTTETGEDRHTPTPSSTDSNSGNHESTIHTKEDIQPSTSGYSAKSSMSKNSESSARLMPPPSLPRAPRSQVSGKDPSINPNPDPQSTVNICSVCGNRVNQDEW